MIIDAQGGAAEPQKLARRQNFWGYIWKIFGHGNQCGRCVKTFTTFTGALRCSVSRPPLVRVTITKLRHAGSAKYDSHSQLINRGGYTAAYSE